MSASTTPRSFSIGEHDFLLDGEPFRVISGAHDGEQSLRGDEVEEAREVEAARGVELAPMRRVLVPRHVGLDGVQAHQPRLVDAVGPEVGVHAEVVQRARKDAERFAVEHEVLVADAERAGLACRVGHGNSLGSRA